MHAADPNSSRLLKLREALDSFPAGLTTYEITTLTNILAVSTTVSELRLGLKPEGLTVRCLYERETGSGARVYRYRIEEAA